jgi:hypothetical protein
LADVAAGGGVLGAAARAQYTSYANGTVPIAGNNEEDDYQTYLNDPQCHGALRGHPDYEDPSYQVARHTFHRFFKLYLSGKADHLPLKAREFFDNFNWQRFQTAAAADRLTMFSQLLARIYHVERDPANDQIPPGPGMALGGATRPAVIAGHLQDAQSERVELVIIRPNIEHNMLGIIMVSLFPCILFAQAPVSLNLTQVS